MINTIVVNGTHSHKLLPAGGNDLQDVESDIFLNQAHLISATTVEDPDIFDGQKFVAALFTEGLAVVFNPEWLNPTSAIRLFGDENIISF